MEEVREMCSFRREARIFCSLSTVVRREVMAGDGRSGVERLVRRFLVEGLRRVSGDAVSIRLTRESRVEMNLDEAEERRSVA